MTTDPPAGRPVLSVVTPTYNQAAFLRDTVESVLSQDYPDIEYLVIDDGSTDHTRQVLSGYDGRVRWESRANQGQTPTINEGWARATGDVLTWLNSDDTFLPGAVSTVMSYLESHPDVGIVFGDSLFTDQDNQPLERTKSRSGFDYTDFVVKCENPISQPSAFIRRSVVEDVGPLDPNYYYFMDWDYWLRAGVRHRIAYVPGLLSTYRLHAESKTVAQSRRAAPELERMYQTYFARGDVPAAVRRREREALANMDFTSGGYYIRGGEAHARRLALRALRRYPELVFRPAMLHKFLYCLFSGHPSYSAGRGLLRRGGPTPGR